jgi:hypothetical protein
LRADQPLMQAIAGEVRRHHSFTSRADTILDVMAGC